jgi:hypothetical protein
MRWNPLSMMRQGSSSRDHSYDYDQRYDDPSSFSDQVFHLKR